MKRKRKRKRKDKVIKWKKKVNLSGKPGMEVYWYGQRYCKVMNRINFRYWFCDCHYTPPYGKVIAGHCKKHD